MKKISSSKISLRKYHQSKKFHFKNKNKNNDKSNQNRNQNKSSLIKTKSQKKNFTKTKCLHVIQSLMSINLKENRNNLNFKNKNPYKNYSIITRIIKNMSI